MDTSEKYIEMCSKATEIQEQRKSHRDWEDQDFCLHIDENGCYDIESCNAQDFGLFRKNTTQKGVIWLPRQDQIQDIIDIKIPNYVNKSHILLDMFYETIHPKNKEKYRLYQQFTSMEQLWLVFMMQHHGKIWNDEKQEWDNVKS